MGGQSFAKAVDPIEAMERIAAAIRRRAFLRRHRLNMEFPLRAAD
jgi:hypothetical protein